MTCYDNILDDYLLSILLTYKSLFVPRDRSLARLGGAVGDPVCVVVVAARKGVFFFDFVIVVVVVLGFLCFLLFGGGRSRLVPLRTEFLVDGPVDSLAVLGAVGHEAAGAAAGAGCVAAGVVALPRRRSRAPSFRVRFNFLGVVVVVARVLLLLFSSSGGNEEVGVVLVVEEVGRQFVLDVVVEEVVEAVQGAREGGLAVVRDELHAAEVVEVDG
mmetsp:Transcript_4957/g.16259  ORF Transcript_4957/g.16259 Transcript_4957/m.16259 type:complete len:215 (+) Transcript_4957:1898-2542(+)